MSAANRIARVSQHHRRRPTVIGPRPMRFLRHRILICIDLSSNPNNKFYMVMQCAGSRTDGMPTVDQSDMRGLVTA
jgi:hypothetical protein